MNPVVVTAVFSPNPGQKDQLLAAVRDAIPAVHQEKGCELYAIHDAEDGTLVMLEKWTTATDLEAHSNGPAVDRLRELIEPFVAGPITVTTMTAAPAGTEAQGAL